MKISRFIHVIDDEKVWDAINKEIITLDSEKVNYIKNNKGVKELTNIPKDLIELGIVIDEKKEKDKIKILANSILDNQFQSLYLITTTNCNLDCDYCFYRSSSSETLKYRENMEFDIAKTSIDKFHQVTANNIIGPEYWQQITFYGGEPLLNKELLIKAIPYARDKFKDNYTSIVVNTNLTVIDDKLISIFKDNNVEIQVSLDGDKDLHDIYRKTISGEGTYEVVIRNMKKLLNQGIKVLPMLTATNVNVNNLNEILLNIIKELNIDEFAVNILITDSFKVDEKYAEILANEMLKSYELFGMRANDHAFVDLYMKIIGKDKTISRNNCGSTRKITVFPSGEVYSCQALEKLAINKMGSLTEDFINNPNWKLWYNRNRFNNETCLDCEVVASCGGGCATGSYNHNKSIYDIDYNQCNYTKKLFKELIKSKK
jgi:uncharacterized protein